MDFDCFGHLRRQSTSVRDSYCINEELPLFSGKSVTDVPCLPLQIAVWNSYRGMNLTESNRDKNNNVTDSLANRTLIVTTILVRKKVKRRTKEGKRRVH